MSFIPLNQVANVSALVEQRAALSSEATFLIEARTGRELTFGGFADTVLALSGWLRGQGIGAGSVVMWQMPTGIDAVALMYALARVGAVQAPVIHLYRGRELGDLLGLTHPTHVLVAPPLGDHDFQATMVKAVAGRQDLTLKPAIAVVPDTARLPVPESVPDVVAPTVDEVRWYYFSSGTTALPKGARHTDTSLMSAGHFIGSTLGVSGDDIGTIGYPIAHIGGIAYSSMCLFSGMAVVLLDNYHPDNVVAAFNRYGVTQAGGSTAHYQVLLAEQMKQPGKPLVPTLKVLSGGGAAKPTALFDQVKKELGVIIAHAYGMTEAPITTCNAPTDTDEQLSTTDGSPMPGLEIRIVDDQGKDVAPGSNGEILLRGPNLCKGYLDAGQTDAAFDDDGFFHTGDIGLLRPDGHLCVTGRIKDVIIRKGENISAREIEELLAKHPKVKDVAVIGLPDEERGEMVCAVVEVNNAADPLTFDEMKTFLTDQDLMRQKIPERLEIVRDMPRSQTLQKVQKNLLREQIINRG